MRDSTVSRLRRYRAADAPFVERLAKAAFQEYSPSAGAPSVRAALQPGVITLVAAFDDAPVGFAMLVVPAGGSASASLDAIAVEPAHRGRGIGKLLLAGVEQKAREAGARELRLVTADANLGALDLFLRSGFAIAERLRRYYPRGQDAVGMRKALAP